MSAIAHRDNRREAQQLAGKAPLTEELDGVQNGDDRFLALVGCQREFHLARVEIPCGVWSYPF
jgi:hypothetical protein